MSTTTTCEVLYVGTLASDAIDLVLAYAADPKSVTPEQIEPVIRGLESAASSAGDELVPLLEGQIVPLETMRARLAHENPPELVDFNGFKASALELTDVCDSL